MHISLSIHISIHPRLNSNYVMSKDSSKTFITERISHENPPAQRKPHTLTNGCIFFQYTYASCSIHPQYSFLSNRCSGCLLRDSQPANPQSTYIEWPMHPLCAATHTREYLLSVPAKPRKNVSILLQTESVPVE